MTNKFPMTHLTLFAIQKKLIIWILTVTIFNTCGYIIEFTKLYLLRICEIIK